MQSIEFENAFYIKLGKNGEWEKSSIKENKMRIGWPNQTLEDINNGNWLLIKEQIQEEISNKIVATRDFNSLRTICESTENDLWITFHASKLWWCRVGEQEIYEDSISKYRKVKGKWFDKDINGKALLINEISGRIVKIQGYRATQCKVKETSDLMNLLNDEPSDEFKEIRDAKQLLILKVKNGLKRLHWKDFETLVDLIFRQSGWRRLTTLGETMKYVDLELEDPITGDLYQVQVKSQATLKELNDYAKQFAEKGFRKLYFVVHSPDNKLMQYRNQKLSNVELILPERLSEMLIDLGLTNWLIKKIK